MGMMGKMRSLASWFILLVGGLFVLFMVLSDSNLASFVGQRRNVVGSINGYDVSYQEFVKMIENARNMQQQQGRDIEESQMPIFRDQVWDAIVTQKLIEEKIEEFGIIVTDEEVKDVLLGPNPPADLRQSFIDSTGTFNREMYETALFDPRNKQILVQLEDRVRQEKMQSKLQALLFATVNVTDEEIKRSYIEQNMKISAEYAFLNYNAIPDSTIKVSENDIQKYFNDHKKEYATEAQRKIKYVLFRKQPSLGDTTAVINDLKAILKDLEKDTSSFKTFVEIYSEQPFAQDTVSLNTIPEQARDLVTAANSGEVVGPVVTNEGCVVYKLIGKTKSTEPLVRASHILIKGDNEEAKTKANNLYAQLKNGANFEQMATTESEDAGSAVRGGDVGWFGKGQMVDEFTNACYSGKVGQVQAPVKSRFGYHVIKVTGKNDQKYIVERIIRKINASGTTLDKLYNDANDFSYLGINSEFIKEAELLKYNVIESYPFDEKTKSIPGLGQNEGLVKFAFENSVGSVSEVYNVPAGYAVAMVSEEIPAGNKPLDDVKEEIVNKIRKERKALIAKEKGAEMKKLLAGGNDLSKSSSYSPQVMVDKAENFTANGRIPGVGQEYAFVNYAIEAKLNVVSEPIVGNRGVYLVKVTDRTPFDESTFAVQKYTLRENLLRQKKSRLYTEWIAKVKEEADIEDNRYKFWR